MSRMTSLQLAAAIVFALALLHTFCTKFFDRLADRSVRHAGVFHLLAEVEIVFGFWACVLVIAMALLEGPARAVAYAESRQYTEPLFVFVVMVIAASRPVLDGVRRLLAWLARRAPVRPALATAG
jgi:cbb3-type cytochrome oxidase subunit 1